MRGMQKVLVIVGPTASGKSSLAVKMARKLKGEVISADSRQVYKGLDIGTGKITRAEMKGVPHHLLDVANPKKVFTAHDFLTHGCAALEDILSRGKTPIICGGTGFYIDSLLGRIVLPNVPANPKLRKQLSTKSAAQLFAMLKKLDARRAKDIDMKNPVRLIRAIEIAKALGHVPVQQPRNHNYREPTSVNGLPRPVLGKIEITWIGVRPGAKALRTKIHKRLLARMKQGMITEARRLHTQGLSYKRMNQLGLEYRYLALLLQEKITKKEMLTKLENDIWQYAKRQNTYWKRNPEIVWHAPDALREIEQRVQTFVGT